MLFSEQSTTPLLRNRRVCCWGPGEAKPNRGSSAPGGGGLICERSACLVTTEMAPSDLGGKLLRELFSIQGFWKTTVYLNIILFSKGRLHNGRSGI